MTKKGQFSRHQPLLFPPLLLFLVTVTTTTMTTAVRATSCNHGSTPQLSIEHHVKGVNNESVSRIRCNLSCAGKPFVPQITLIHCTRAEDCDDVTPCLDKGFRTENTERCLKQVFEGSPHLDYEMYGFTGIVQCHDTKNLSLKTTDFILQPAFMTGREIEREALLGSNSPRSDLISIGHDRGTTPHVIYKNGIRVFYPDGEETIYAIPSRFFFHKKCDWTLRFADGTARDLYRDNGHDPVLTREFIKFKVPRNNGTISCSVFWYNSTTERLEIQFPFIIIDPIQATAKPEVDRAGSGNAVKFVGFENLQKVKCKFSGFGSDVVWFSGEEIFENMTKESYRNLLDKEDFESVIEMRYGGVGEPQKYPVDNLTCVITNKLGTDSHIIFLTKSSSLKLNQISPIYLSLFAAVLTFMPSYI